MKWAQEYKSFFSPFPPLPLPLSLSLSPSPSPPFPLSLSPSLPIALPFLSLPPYIPRGTSFSLLLALNHDAVVLCGSAQRYRALMVILQSHRTQNMILRCYPNVAICYTSETYQILSPVLFQQSLYFPLLIHRIFYLLVKYSYRRNNALQCSHISV